MPQNPNICIVDDDEVYKFFVKKILKIKNLAKDALTFPDGEEAYKFIKENRENLEKLPDIIFLDINMPIMDGFQFMDEYTKIHNEINKKITIYMITSSIDPVDLERSKKYDQISDFITKPISAEVLQRIINPIN
ncbi:Response regulator receiver domain-containing protein [Polaribacter sp. KT25b]|uniref:response regulator n=1 Tax=Polaribacter sp. KT25b TaxID=1855336 RepID=UPI00087C18CB|nr:response regulator [Polaribacter sp. KT25b]SDS36687.1 Response regulator receiver domain-containing protein [Polaribacter sp. KT25b]